MVKSAIIQFVLANHISCYNEADHYSTDMLFLLINAI